MRPAALLLALAVAAAACSGTTQPIALHEIAAPPRAAAAVPEALGEVTVTSRVASFDTDDERAGYARSLRSALQRSGLFGDDAARPYRLSVSIEDFSIPKASFGGFNSTLDVRYELRDAAGTVVYAGLVQSAGADDTGSPVGVVRQNRSRTRAVAENMATFLHELGPRLERHGRATAPSPPPAAPPAATPPGPVAPARSHRGWI
jgi:hypothetical protein